MKNLDTKGQVVGVIITMVVVSIGGWYLIATADYEEVEVQEYQPGYPGAEQDVENAKWDICLKLKNKGTQKLLDDANGVIFDDIDRNTTASYRDMDCNKVKININVDF